MQSESRLAFVFILALLQFACQSAQRRYTHLKGQAQGTTFHITYYDPRGRDFSAQVDSLFRLIDRSMSLWDSTSIIRRINRNEPDVPLDEHFIAVFERAQQFAQATDGVFDITVGPLVRAWGFSYKKGLPPPDSMQVDSLRRLTGYRKVRIVGGRLQKDDPRIELDMNAIAQGYTVDLMAKFLETQGIEHYMVEIGGEVRTAGVNERGERWRIGIDRPTTDTAEAQKRPLQTIISLSNKALATSGSYRKFIERDGKKFSHAIDPRTGYPVSHRLLSVSVVADDCTTADAYATAFLVMGLEEALSIAQRTGLGLYAIYADESGKLQTRSTLTTEE
ncbi:MAG: FAD:protein FMN transferase [Saprospiraceae bacterium]|nr:FAD:protein FMN transferase [Saprospiraceae bacterium]MDW8483326.1 FAD:protein FMN transferase [Saprospiraceae bacterium]